MVSIYKIKPKFQQLLMPILIVLNKMGITANQITLFAIFFSFIIGIAFWSAQWYPVLFLALPLGLFIRMALNALDGMMARTYNQQTKLGEILNELGDVISDIFVFFPLLIFEAHNLWLIISFLLLSIINEFSGVLAKVISGQRRYDGPMGKSDRALILGLYGLLAFWAVDIYAFTVWVFSLVNLLLILSTWKRIKKALENYE